MSRPWPRSRRRLCWGSCLQARHCRRVRADPEHQILASQTAKDSFSRSATAVSHLAGVSCFVATAEKKKKGKREHKGRDKTERRKADAHRRTRRDSSSRASVKRVSSEKQQRTHPALLKINIKEVAAAHLLLFRGVGHHGRGHVFTFGNNAAECAAKHLSRSC